MLSDVVVCNNAALYGSNASQNKRPSNETVKMILEKCPLNVVRKYEPTSFLFKHYHGQYDMIIALLDAGIYVNIYSHIFIPYLPLLILYL